MDNVAHTLAGFVLARSRVVRETPLATTALVVGANLPDVDLAWSAASDLAYFHYHRGFTHSIAGALAGSLALWAALAAWGALRARAGRHEPPRRLRLLAASVVGVFSHLALDATNAYGLRPFLPWSATWVYGDLWFIADPWIWLILGGALAATSRTGPMRATCWALAAAVLTAVVLALPVIPESSRIAWIPAVAAAIVAARRPSSRSPERPPRWALALLLAYGLACAASRHAARARIEPGAAAIGSVALLPRPSDPLRWDAFTVGDRSVRIRVVGALDRLDGPEANEVELARSLQEPATAAVLDSCAGAVLREFFRFPVANSSERTGGEREVVVRDLRFSRDGVGRFGVYRAVVDSAGRPRIDAKACP